MIPLHKLKTLPRTLRLRKAASIFGGAEHRFILHGALPEKDADYLTLLAEYLAENEGFSGAASEVLKAAGRTFAGAAFIQAKDAGNEIRKKEQLRALNSIYHLLLAETGRSQADWDFFEAPGILSPAKRRPFPGMFVYFEDIRSPFNVGSMFRAADSFGAEKLWLSPLCADPRHKRAERSAMGCVDLVPWERLLHDPFTSEPFTKSSFNKGPFFALETGGCPLGDFSFPPKGILIVGSEELGVSPRALETADASLGRVTIPTRGAKGSLNVAVAFGIVMQAWAAALAA